VHSIHQQLGHFARKEELVEEFMLTGCFLLLLYVQPACARPLRKCLELCQAPTI
jgi:hypothetical protein